MSLIQNPILRGFNADPSIIRVEDTYYIANSTFEWFRACVYMSRKT
jgi:xylan 1,4-beta-xylosidase